LQKFRKKLVRGAKNIFRLSAKYLSDAIKICTSMACKWLIEGIWRLEWFLQVTIYEKRDFKFDLEYVEEAHYESVKSNN
jgi:hypothetical protein